jgi:hypothetical protein
MRGLLTLRPGQGLTSTGKNMPSKVLTTTEKRRPPNAGKGRVKGVPNKATADVRTAIAELAQANVSRCQAWLDDIASIDPAKALDLYLRMLEYHVPKLARSEVTGRDGGPVVIQASNHDERL